MSALDFAARTQSASAPTASRADDAALANRAHAGDAAAFELIMRRHNRLLFRAARGVVHDDAEAQDVVQETYLRAFGALGSFRAEASLATWLVRIAINLALDAQRRRGRWVRLDDDHDADAGAAGTPTTEQDSMHDVTTRCGDNPEAAAENAQLRALLQAAIDSLPPRYRSVFILRAVAEMSVDEAAACLGINAETVRTRHLRARALLRDALGARVEAQAHDAYPFAGARCDAVVGHVLARLRGCGLIGPG